MNAEERAGAEIHEPSDATAPNEADVEVARLIEHHAEPDALAPMIAEQDAPDAADALETLDREESAEVVHLMDDESAADALSHMDAALAATVLLDLSEDEAVSLLGRMTTDDAADIVQVMPPDVAQRLVERLHPKRAAQLGKLALYDPETAGGIMTTDILVVRTGTRIGQAIDRIKRMASIDRFAEEQTEVYCVDEQKRLVGSIGLRDLLIVDDDQPLDEHIDHDVDFVTAEVDREEVARIFERYDLLTLPVVDEHRRVLGMITIDDVIDIITAETTEDALKQVGAGGAEAVYSSIGTKLRGRFPWLLVNLLLAALGSAVILFSQDLIELIPITAAIFPIIANQAGNTGHQSMALTLRGIIVGEVRRGRIASLLLREMLFGLITGVLVGITFSLAITALGAIGHSMGFAALQTLDWRIGVVAGAAMIASLYIGCLVGTGVPLVMERLGIDPATASSIFVTMITDLLSYATFLGLVFALRGWLVA